MGKQIFFYMLIFKLFIPSISMRRGNAGLEMNSGAESLYEVRLEDAEVFESNIQKPSTEFELTAEEENELKTGICKVVFNEANTVISRAVYKRNEIALNKMEKNMYLFILSESLKDYAGELKKKINEKKIPVSPDQMDAVESALRIHCDLADLKELYNVLVNFPDLFEDLNTNSTDAWEKFVAIQLDRVYDYVNTHFNMFKKELLRLKNTKAYYERKNFFRKRDGKAILMTIFYDWLENMVCRPKRIDEHAIREKLNAHLKWVVSLPI